jgi:hypothetical protein
MEGSTVRIKVFRGLVYGGGGSAGVVNGGETPMAIQRFKMALGSSIGLLRRVLRPLLTTYLRGRAHVHGWVSGGSPAPPLFLGRALVHGAVGMAATNGFPRWLLFPSLMRTVCPLPRRINLAPSLPLYRLDLEGTTSP